MSDFCLPDSPNPVRAVSKVEQNHPKLKKIFYSVNFAKKSVDSDYGHIAENGLFVRNWSAQKMAIMDKMVKNGRLSVKIQAFRTWFYGQILQKSIFVRKFE